MFDRDIFFDALRGGKMFKSFSQQQVDGLNTILSGWEDTSPSDDTRWLAYMLATTYHETAATIQPIEEYGKGKGQKYGVPDPQTGQTYYGRGYVQLTWRDNYARADEKLMLDGEDSLEWHPDDALIPDVAYKIMSLGMAEGWFRHPNTLSKFFNLTVNDPFGAREIINGDKNTVPSWSNGVSIGNLIAGYHMEFLTALEKSEEPELVTPATEFVTVTLRLTLPKGSKIEIV